MKPYVLTTTQNVSSLDLDLGFDEPIDVFDIADPSCTTFCAILNEGNQLAFGGAKSMGMPLWVMLDCAIVPGGMLGFMMRRRDVEPALASKLKIPDGYDGWVPISEYSACPSVHEGCVSGFSLQTQIEKQGLGTRTKALGLAALRATRQLGVTQFDNPAIRVHSRFGRLEILVHRPVVHTHAKTSFVYSVSLPPKSELLELIHERRTTPARTASPDFQFDPFDETHHSKIHSHLQSGGRVWIERPGWTKTNDQIALPVTLENE